MRLQGFRQTADGSWVLVLFRQGEEEGYYPITIEEAERLSRQLQQAVADAKLVRVKE